MSGIYGILSRDGCPVSSWQLSSMAGALEHRGEAGGNQWCNETVGLGQLSLNTEHDSTCVSRVYDRVGDLVVVADARLDNRDELISVLGPLDVDPAVVTDSQLIRAAYDRWQEECVTRLLGDFAFAVWDSKKQNLFVARDRFGVKPLFFHLSDKYFVFASEIKALFFLPQLQVRLNERMIADHLTGAYTDSEMTFYQDVVRMQPAHSLSVSATGFSKRLYWQLDPERSLKLNSDDEYAQAFRERFTEAVRCRLTGDSSVGGMLSGGLDSSSIAAVAQELLRKTDNRFPTFSLVFDDIPECDERRFINAAIARSGFDSHFVRGDSHGPLSDLERIVSHTDSPVFGPNLFLHWALYREVERKGIGIILDGFDGDSVVSQGYQFLNELAFQKRWLRLGVETIALSRTQRMSPWPTLRRYVQHFGVNPVIDSWKPLRGARRVWRSLTRKSVGALGAGNTQWRELLSPDFIQRNQIEDRYRTWRRSQPQTERTERAGHLRMVTQPTIPMALEIFDHTAAAFSIEARYPFWDSRLVEFCLSIPGQQKLHRGLGRTIMRRALADLLPKEIHQRKEKTDFTPVLRRGLMSVDRQLMNSVLEDTSDLESYVDGRAIRGLSERLSEDPKPAPASDLLSIWRVISLAVWLRAVSRRLKEVRTM